MRSLIVPVLGLMASLLSEPAWATTVTSTADGGSGSLREAIAVTAAGGTIDFQAGLGTITLTSGELLIGKNLTISGPGSGNLTIQRSSAGGTTDFRIFNIAVAATVTISGLTISNGRADFGAGIFNEGALVLDDCVISGNIATDMGGGIGNSGTLTMTDCVITGNSVAGGPGVDARGGGVFNDGTLDSSRCTVQNNTVVADAGSLALGGGVFNDGTLTADNWTIFDNSAEAGAGSFGGGLYNGGSLEFTEAKISTNTATGGAGASGGGGGIFSDGDLTLIASTVDDNTAKGGDGSSPGAGFGGGIFAGEGGTMELDRSTISRNSAVGGAGGNGGSSEGGGIWIASGTVLVFNSTVSGNLLSAGAGAPTHGGGIFNDIGTLTLLHSTISANVVPSSSEDGGGIHNSGGSVDLKNTIVAANTATVDFFDQSNLVVSSGFNVIGTTSPTISPGPNDQFNVTAAELKIGPLQNNGGPTFTQALLCESPALNAGDNTDAPDTDQRGTGFDRIVDGVIDIGAFEGAAADMTVTKQCSVPPPPPEPFDCGDAKPLDSISMEWSGSQTIGVKAWKGAVGSTLLATINNIAPGNTVTVTGYAGSPNDVIWEIFNGTASGTKIGQSTFHLSCSDDDMDGPEDCDKLEGDGKGLTGFINQWIFQGMAGNGLALNCSPIPPPEGDTSCVVQKAPPSSCTTLGKPTSLTFRYTGGGCGASNNPQSGKATCSGSINSAQAITVSSANGYTISPTLVNPGGVFTVSTGSFNAQSGFTLNNSGGTETLSIHTSCSQPLAVGDVFGSLTLVGFNGQAGGSSVIYTYTVTNNGATPLSDVNLTDDVFGHIAGPFNLAANGTQIFEFHTQISETTTNIATASVLGGCAAVSNSVTVTVNQGCSISAGAANFGSKNLKLPLLNSGNTRLTVTDIVLAWPAGNGRLLKVKMDGDIIWDRKSPAGATSIVLGTSDLTGSEGRRSIDAGRDRNFTLEFEKNVSTTLSNYSITIVFDWCIFTLQ